MLLYLCIGCVLISDRRPFWCLYRLCLALRPPLVFAYHMFVSVVSCFQTAARSLWPSWNMLVIARWRRSGCFSCRSFVGVGSRQFWAMSMSNSDSPPLETSPPPEDSPSPSASPQIESSDDPPDSLAAESLASPRLESSATPESPAPVSSAAPDSPARDESGEQSDVASACVQHSDESDAASASVQHSETEQQSESDAASASVQQSGSESAAKVAAPATKRGKRDAVSASVRVETFDPHTFGSLEEHVKSHAYPAHVATCGPCKFWKHRWDWTAQASFEVNASTKQRETWLGCKNGFAICLVCAAYTGAGRRDKLAEGTASFVRWGNIKRHGNLCKRQKLRLPDCKGFEKGINWTHELALRAWIHRAKAAALGADSATVSGKAAALGADSVTVSEKHDAATAHTIGYRAFLFSRVLLETKGTFRNFEQWSAAAVTGDSAAASVASRWQCTRRLKTIAEYERLVTQSFLKAGTAHRLQADGLDRTYQVEIGTVLWRFPASLRYFQDHCGRFPWLTSLGDKGPWLVERVIGMHEFPDDMGTDAKVSMLESCVRRAAVSVSADLNVDLHSHIRQNVRVWTSDGADRDVGLAATGPFPNLAFHAWDESHSAGRLLQNALKDDPEIGAVDKLLVTGKKPYSLAKFLSTSGVFRKKFGDAQQAEGVAFLRNFGWAPQRFESRAKPYARECRRWNAIWTSVAAEAASASDKGRKELAESFLSELGGEYSRRLLLAGFLADLAAEHYAWVASGDKANPDTTTVVARAESFCRRLHVLFTQGLILTLPNTYTGETVTFLKENTYFHYGKRVQCFGLGDWNQDSVQRVVRAELKRVQVVVANIKELLKVYRPTSSWFQAFAAFALPSPLGASGSRPSASGAAGAAADCAAACRASLQIICSEAKLPCRQTVLEWARLLPRAEVFSQQRLHSSRGMGSRFRRISRTATGASPRGALPRLEDEHWQFGAAISCFSRGRHRAAGSLVGRHSGSLYPCGPSAFQRDVAKLVVLLLGERSG